MIDRAMIRRVVRIFWSSPRFAVGVSLTFALAIGLNSMMFGVIDRLLIRPAPHVVAPAELRRVFASLGSRTTGIFSYSAYTGMSERVRSVDGAAAYGRATAIAGNGVDAREIEGATATGNLFSLLGVHAMVGRLFTAAEDDTRRPADVAVISYDLWLREYGGSRDVLGRTLAIGEQRFSIIGVLPRGFAGTELRRIDFWIPMSSAQDPGSNWTTTWRQRWLSIVVRVQDGREEQAARELSLALRNAQPSDMHLWSKSNLSLRAVWADESGNQPAAIDVVRWLSGVAVVVLLIACVNVTNLFLARTLDRRREIAVRLALGIDRSRLIRLLVSDVLVLAVTGGLIGIAFAYVGGQLVRQRFLPDVMWDSPPVDFRVIAAAAALTLVAGLVTGLFPAIQAAGADVVSALKAGGRAGGVRHAHVRASLLVAEAALAAMLLIAAGLFIRSLVNVRGLDLGFQPKRALSVTIDWPSSVDTASRRALWLRIRDEVAASPDFEGAALVTGSPFGNFFGFRLRIPGRDSLPSLGGPWIAAVSRDYFAALDVRLLSGRLFDAHEGAGTEPVTIVNETMARAVWPGEEPLGRCMLIGGGQDVRCSRVVGVVADVRQAALVEDATMQYYVPLGQERFPAGEDGIALELLARPRATGGSATASVDRLRRVIARAAPVARFVRVQPMQDRVDPLMRSWQLGAELFGLFAALALLVTAVGLYSVVAYVTSQRMHEFGVRTALGAQRHEVLSLVMGGTLRTTASGIAIGVAGSLVASRWLEPLLFKESSRDPVVFSVVGVVLLAVTIVASWAPASLATKADPLVALRTE